MVESNVASTDALDLLDEIDFATSIEDLESMLSDYAESLSVESMNFDWDSSSVNSMEKFAMDFASHQDAGMNLECTEEICFASSTHSCVDCQDAVILQPRKKYAGTIGSNVPVTKNISSTDSSPSMLNVQPDVDNPERRFHFPSAIDQLWCPGCWKSIPVFAKEQERGEIILFRKISYGFKNTVAYPYRFDIYLKGSGASTAIAAQRGFCSRKCYSKKRKLAPDGSEWMWTFHEEEFRTAFDMPGVRIVIPSHVDKKLTFRNDNFWEPMLFDKILI
jgi:hypothetical protein